MERNIRTKFQGVVTSIKMDKTIFCIMKPPHRTYQTFILPTLSILVNSNKKYLFFIDEI